MGTRSVPSRSRTAASCRCTATGCSDHSRTPRTLFRMLYCPPGKGSDSSRGVPRSERGSIASPPTVVSTRFEQPSRRPAKEWEMPEVEPPEPTGFGEVVWLEPYPDSLLEGAIDMLSSPEARYEQTDAISLAFVTALQVLPARQRAVLILCEVLGYRANEVADMLDSTVDSVNNALKRARSSLQRRGRARTASRSRLALRAGARGKIRPSHTRPVMWQRSSACSPKMCESPCHQSRSNTKVSTWSPASTPAFSAEAAGPMTSCPRCGRTARLHSELTFESRPASPRRRPPRPHPRW